MTAQEKKKNEKDVYRMVWYGLVIPESNKMPYPDLLKDNFKSYMSYKIAKLINSYKGINNCNLATYVWTFSLINIKKFYGVYVDRYIRKKTKYGFYEISCDYNLLDKYKLSDIPIYEIKNMVLHQMINMLPPEQSKYIYMNYFYGYSQYEIAKLEFSSTSKKPKHTRGYIDYNITQALKKLKKTIEYYNQQIPNQLSEFRLQ